jgi:tetratricopeptide (TPR) repeat protein
MPDSLRDRYLSLLDNMIEMTLKGQIRSKEQVYQMLVKDIETGTGEIFERVLAERVSQIETTLKTEKDELKKAKATRSQRAIKTIQTEWERWQKDNQISGLITSAGDQILAASSSERLTILFRILDPNQQHPLTIEQLQKLAKLLHQKLLQTSNPDTETEVQQILAGITQGIASWQKLEGDLVSWIYQRSNQIGFAGTPEDNGPWALWAKKLTTPVPKALFKTLSLNESIPELINQKITVEAADLVELAIILQGLQRGLVNYFDKLVYDSKIGAKLSISTFLTFAVIWSFLANGFERATSLNSSTRERFTNACFQVTLQILRAFSQRDYFPLYGGIFASFAGQYLRNALDYLDEPLKQVPGTQEKARILTLLGYSQRAQGRYDRAITFHEQALEIAQQADDQACMIANYNHLSRTYVSLKNYADAIRYSQRALILSRQTGNRLGESNALANFGFSEVFQAKQQDQLEPEVYESAIHYLEQGLQLAEKLADRQSQALCYSSLGIAYVTIDQPQEALQFLAKGLEFAQYSGDLYLQGLTFAYISQAYYSATILQKAVAYGSLGMYLLEQIGAGEWRQPAALLTIIQGQWGEGFDTALKQSRPEIIAFIGVDGYDHIPQLLKNYQQSME